MRAMLGPGPEAGERTKDDRLEHLYEHFESEYRQYIVVKPIADKDLDRDICISITPYVQLYRTIKEIQREIKKLGLTIPPRDHEGLPEAMHFALTKIVTLLNQYQITHSKLEPAMRKPLFSTTLNNLLKPDIMKDILRLMIEKKKEKLPTLDVTILDASPEKSEYDTLERLVSMVQTKMKTKDENLPFQIVIDYKGHYMTLVFMPEKDHGWKCIVIDSIGINPRMVPIVTHLDQTGQLLGFDIPDTQKPPQSALAGCPVFAADYAIQAAKYAALLEALLASLVRCHSYTEEEDEFSIIEDLEKIKGVKIVRWEDMLAVFRRTSQTSSLLIDDSAEQHMTPTHPTLAHYVGTHHRASLVKAEQFLAKELVKENARRFDEGLPPLDETTRAEFIKQLKEKHYNLAFEDRFEKFVSRAASMLEKLTPPMLAAIQQAHNTPPVAKQAEASAGEEAEVQPRF
jgi:hypothetical protein